MPPKGKRNKSLGNQRPKKKSKIPRRNNATFHERPKEPKEPEEPEIIDDIMETYEGTESKKLERQKR